MIPILTATVSALPSAPALSWRCTVAAQPWAERPAVPLLGKPPVPTDPHAVVFVDSRRKLQRIDGFGGCFNERGWKAMLTLPAGERDALMRNLFDPREGLKLNIARTPIGASDYATELYSLDETPGDYAMRSFSADRDDRLLIPYIKAALAIRPDLKLWAVPWSPPSWMKDNNSLVSGHIKDDPKTLDALALYFARYVQAYRKRGLDVGMVMPQNEPNISSDYTSCLWTGEQLAKFLGYHLGPTFKKEGLKTKIWLGTVQNSSRGGYAYWIGPTMQDPNVRKYVEGVGCQWDAAPAMAQTHFLYPDLPLMQTESECGSSNQNDWAFGEYQFALAKKWFAAGANSHMVWNLVLDETGKSTAGWAQCSPVVVDTRTRKVVYTPYYWMFRHLSSYVRPGAHALETLSDWGDRIAFVNPDGEVVVVVGNSSAKDLPVSLNVDGRESQTVTLPAHSFSTFTLRKG